ncbi:MAG: phage terminase large subunit [Betaproteobacteria bacterium]|nr:phage terminase large subunit [Betaproteobacteria bacterium]
MNLQFSAAGGNNQALEAGLRLAAERSLVAYAQATFKGYRASWHHRLIAQRLQRVADVPAQRLIITMPPRHGKTELASIRLAPWLLTRRPKASIIAATYAQDFADELGRKARAVMQTTAHRWLAPHAALAPDNRAVSRWQTVSGGSYYAVGVGGPLTGRGADVLLIDDPHKNRAEAESKVSRDTVWDWFRSTAYTRLEKGASVAIIMTRWHEDDLVGRCLETGEPWDVLSLAAIAEQDEPHRRAGEALWPEKYPLDTLEQIRRTVGEREWAALYQQRPAPLEGALFKPDQLQVLDAEPAGVDWVRAWDFGATRDGDPTVGAKLGLWNGRPVIADIVRIQGPPELVERTLLATASRDGNGVRIDLPQDPGQAGKSQVQNFTSMLRGYTVRSSPETGDKVLRAEPLAAQVNVGNVFMVRAAWNAALVDEMRVFPNGSHDDQVDALSRAYAALINKPNTALIDYLAGLKAAHDQRKPSDGATSWRD